MADSAAPPPDATSPPPDGTPSSCRLALHAHTLVTSRGPRTTEQTVICPARRSVMSARACAACPRCTGISLDPLDGFVECRAEAPNGRLASTGPVTAVMRADVVTLRAGVDVATATQVFLAQELCGAAVVDVDGRPIGLLGREELLRAWSARNDGDAHRTVGEVMSPIVITLLESAPISAAVRLLGMRGSHPLPVVAGDGRVVGTVSPADLLRWLGGSV